MGPTISVSHWLDFWVLIISSRFDLKAALSIPPSWKDLIGVFGSALAGGLWACSQYVPIVEKVTVWWRSARDNHLLSMVPGHYSL